MLHKWRNTSGRIILVLRKWRNTSGWIIETEKNSQMLRRTVYLLSKSRAIPKFVLSFGNDFLLPSLEWPQKDALRNSEANQVLQSKDELN